jgi:hypothetical protein
MIAFTPQPYELHAFADGRQWLVLGWVDARNGENGLRAYALPLAKESTTYIANQAQVIRPTSVWPAVKTCGCG